MPIHTTAADRGRIEIPVLTPHFDFRQLDEDRVLLLSEDFNTILNGRVICDLLPLLVENRSRQDLVNTLACSHSATAIEAALNSLASRGYLVSGDHAMDSKQAAFWSSLGASPRWVEEQLSRGGVEVLDNDHQLASQLSDIGVDVNPIENPLLTVISCADFQDQGLGKLNRQHLASGTPWMLAKPIGMEVLYGPVFRPSDRGPCWACLEYRLSAHREVHNFLRNFAGNDAAFIPRAAEPVMFKAILGLIAMEIAKWLVFGNQAPLHEHALTLDIASLKHGLHKVNRRPQCPVCGDPSLYRADRPPDPIRLQPSPKTLANSGGVRSVSPEQTLARYRHLVSHISGVVSWLERTSDETDDWLHTHWAGSNFVLRSGNLDSLRRSLRSKAAGKGSTSGQSAVSAFCEAIERYCGGIHGDEIVTRKRYRDFADSGQSEAIQPNDLQLFSEQQFDNAERINALDHPYNFIPNRFDPDSLTDWTPVWSLTNERHKFLPTSIMYSNSVEKRGPRGLRADSNGCAAGNTLEEAILQGFFELVERDAFAIWWYNLVRRPGVDLKSFDDPFLDRAEDYYCSAGRDLRVLDITHDLGIPVFVAVSRLICGDQEDIIYGAGAHLSAKVAVLRAVCEMNQFLNWLGHSSKSGKKSDINEPMCLDWFENARMVDHPYLEADREIPLRRSQDYCTSPQTEDTRDDIEFCSKLVADYGMEFMVLNQTRPDIGLPVARVIVPGMRHFWERFAPGRLYDVPVKLGWLDHPLAEEDLNPAPVII